MRTLFSSLVVKLSLLFFLLALVPVIILISFGAKEIENEMSTFLYEQEKSRAEALAPVIDFLENNNLSYLVDDFVRKQKATVFVIDKHGDVAQLSSGFLDGGVLPREYLDESILKIEKSTSPGKVSSIIDYAHDLMITAVPQRGAAHLVFVESIATVKRIIKLTVGRIALFVVVSIFFTTALLGGLLYILIGIPLKILTNASMSISRGQFDIHIDPDVMTGELKILASAFSFSAGEIAKGVKELKAMVKLEKERNNQILELNEQLSLSAVRYKEIFNSSFAAIFIHDTEGNVVSVNKTMLSMYHLSSEEEALSFTIADYSSRSRGRREIASKIAQTMKDGEVVFEWDARRPLDDSTFAAMVSLKRVSFGREGKKYLLANVLNITNRKAAEEQLVRAQKLETVGSLAGGIAHDFNNILGGIMGPISMVEYKLDKSGTIDREMLLKYLGTMNAAASRAAEVVKQLLTLSSKNKPAFSTVDLNGVFESINSIAKSSVDKSVNLVINTFSGGAFVWGDSVQIEQIFLNLVLNAVHAMTFMRGADTPWGGTLTVTINEVTADTDFCRAHPPLVPGRYYLISVTDTGVGMDHDVLNNIFNPFFTTKEKGKGTGLGLAMVYNLIRLHKGTITVYSEKGKGSVFSVYLPAAAGSAGESAANDGGNIMSDREGTILVIDDDEVVRSLAKDMLETAGYTVILAKEGEEGIDLLKKHRDAVDLVILDMVMPGISGKVVFPRLREIKSDIKVLFSSGFRHDKRVEEVIKEGAQGFIEKPYTLQKLLEVVSGILDV